MNSKRQGWVWLAASAALLASGTAGPAVAAASKPAAAPQAASAPTSIGTFKSWTAWKGNDANGLICYVSSEPTSSKPEGVNRDPVHFLVVNRKGLGIKNEVQTLIGYPLKKDGKPTATIDKKTYAMIADGSGAWLASAADEAGFVAALKAGTTLVVKGTSQRGTETTDTYSLAGVSAALAASDKACS
ncbi:MAG TPA: invasion associated locus B family protein [Devosiaceae bacterium]|jgi:hypothetical protein|nr:invasion associated locus B family protein [Devosiaceae bacterium]